MSYNYTAGDVMDDTSALLNDRQAGVFDYTAQLPYLKIAMRNFEQQLDLAEFQINLVIEAQIVVLAGATTLTLPDNFFLPINLFEKKNGTTDTLVQMSQRADVDTIMSSPTDTITYWSWVHNCIRFKGTHTVDRLVQLFYYRFLTEFADETSLADVRGGRNVLAFRTAALCARYIGRNKDIANDLDNDYARELDLFLSLITKNQQSIRVRRRPFRTKWPNPPLLVRIP